MITESELLRLTFVIACIVLGVGSAKAQNYIDSFSKEGVMYYSTDARNLSVRRFYPKNTMLIYAPSVNHKKIIKPIKPAIYNPIVSGMSFTNWTIIVPCKSRLKVFMNRSKRASINMVIKKHAVINPNIYHLPNGFVTIKISNFYYPEQYETFETNREVIITRYNSWL